MIKLLPADAEFAATRLMTDITDLGIQRFKAGHYIADLDTETICHSAEALP